MPSLEKDITEKKSFGSLMHLLKWIEKYELVVLRAGISDKSTMENLKVKATFLLPNFIDYLGDQFKTMLQQAVLQDKQDLSSIEQIKNIIQEKNRNMRNDGEASQEDVLVSEYPITVFKVLNDQISLLRDSLKGEAFV